MNGSKVQIGVALFLIGIWAISVGIRWFNPDFQMPDGVVPMALIAGGFLLGDHAVRLIRRNGNGNGNGKR